MAKIEVSVVLPCLNEEKTIGICIEKAMRVFRENGIEGEVVVVDNGSTDNSAKIAHSKGARVISESRKGYGRAYCRGFSEAYGKYILMADADNTYDLLELPKFIEPLRGNEADIVMGSRFKGRILPKAMPWLHQYVGNPALTFILNSLFHSRLSDTQCGMRAFRKEILKDLDLKCGGMEFASEMLIKALKEKLRIKEVPITYYPRESRSKLRSFHDGWRHLRFMMLFAPNYTFLLPGMILMLLGVGLGILLLKGPLVFGKITLDLHPAVFASMLAIVGYQIFLMGIYAKRVAVKYGFEKEKGMIKWLSEKINLEKGILIGLLVFVLGLIVDVNIVYKWWHSGFGAIFELKAALLALTFVVIGLQTMFSSWFLSMLEIEKIY